MTQVLQILRNKAKGISLGISENEKEIFMRYPMLNKTNISDNILVSGRVGSGKSVVKKLIAHQMSYYRPVILLDPPGRDDYLCYHPNRSGKNLPKGMRPEGLHGLYFYYPVISARAKERYEILRQPNFAKYKESHFRMMGFSPGAAIYLTNILSKVKFKDMDALIDYINENKKIEYNAKTSLLKILPSLNNQGIFRMDNKKELNLMPCFMQGINMVISYNDFMLARLEISYLIERLIEYRDSYPKGYKPFIFVDEAHLIFDQSELLDKFVLVFRKLGVGLCIVMPTINNISDNVLDQIKTMVIGKYKGKGATKLIEVIDHPDAYKIKNLKFNRFTGERQFAYYTSDYEYFMIIDKVYQSPCEIHRVEG